MNTIVIEGGIRSASQHATAVLARVTSIPGFALLVLLVGLASCSAEKDDGSVEREEPRPTPSQREEPSEEPSDEEPSAEPSEPSAEPSDEEPSAEQSDGGGSKLPTEPEQPAQEPEDDAACAAAGGECKGVGTCLDEGGHLAPTDATCAGGPGTACCLPADACDEETFDCCLDRATFRPACDGGKLICVIGEPC